MLSATVNSILSSFTLNPYSRLAPLAILSRVKRSPKVIPLYARLLTRSSQKKKVALTATQADYWVHALMDYYPKTLRGGVSLFLKYIRTFSTLIVGHRRC